MICNPELQQQVDKVMRMFFLSSRCCMKKEESISEKKEELSLNRNVSVALSKETERLGARSNLKTQTINIAQ